MNVLKGEVPEFGLTGQSAKLLVFRGPRVQIPPSPLGKDLWKMSKEMLYRQCSLERKNPSGTTNTVSHIPIKYAVVGKILKLKNLNGEWEDSWVVTSVGEVVPVPESSQRIIREHRKRTGDALPKRKQK